jgi:hypothetical protein
MTKISEIIKWFKKNRENVIRTSYVIPILIAAGISVYHVVSWYGMMNPISWAIYLSVGVEIAALSALAGMTAKMNKFVYVPFFIVTLIQLIGNIFATFEYISVNDESFKSWILLVEPFFDSIGLVDSGDILGHRRFLAFLGGVFIPIISLSFLHMLVSFNEKQVVKKEDDNEKLDSLEEKEIKEENSIQETIVEEEKEEELEFTKKEEEELQDEIKEDFEDFVKKKKEKLKEDRKVFVPLLELFYKKGEIKEGDIMPTYPEFKSLVEGEGYSDDNIKMFLTLCNYLEITQLSDNTRTATKSYEKAKEILESYLSLDDNKEENNQADYLTKKWHLNRRDRK